MRWFGRPDRDYRERTASAASPRRATRRIPTRTRTCGFSPSAPATSERSPSPATAEKELVLGVVAYNAIRAAINDAATALKLDPRDFSFSAAQDTINAFLPLLANARSERQRKAIVQEMLRVFSYSRLPRRRKRRSAPRTVWPRPSSFPTLKISKPTGSHA